MSMKNDQRKKRIEREQGDVNTTPSRSKYWARNLQGEARKIFEDDKKYFMQQALSTPVLNVLERAEGAHIMDLQGNAYIDMHGNGVHNAGFNNPEIIMYKCMQNGLAFKTIEGNVITLRPALVITRDEMDRALDILDIAIGEVEKGDLF